MTQATPIKATFSDFRPWSRYKRGRTAEELFYEYTMPIPFCGCVVWIGAMSSRGYGSLKFKGSSMRAHRFAWETFRGPIPDGLCVCHHCDVTSCVNPDHLFLGTQLENAQDRERKGRGNQPSGERNGHHTKPWRTARGDSHYTRLNPGTKQGTGNGRAKLSESEVLAIRVAPGNNAEIARSFGMTRSTIRNIKLNKLWRHI